jgi:hypothetical protein
MATFWDLLGLFRTIWDLLGIFGTIWNFLGPFKKEVDMKRVYNSLRVPILEVLLVFFL